MSTSDLKQQKPKVKEEYRLEEIDGELLLYSLASTRSIYLNSSASIIWQLCTGEQSVSDMIDIIKEGFPEAQDSAEQDVLQTVEQFIESEAVTLS